MRRVYATLCILSILLLPHLSPFAGFADAKPHDKKLKQEVQGLLKESRKIIEKAQKKLTEGIPVTAEINELKELAKQVRSSHLSLDDQLKTDEEEIKSHGAKAIERHRAISEGYRETLQEYLSLIEALPLEERLLSSHLDPLKNLLDQKLHKEKRPILGTLPYKNLKLPPREPISDPSIKPAYKGGDKTVIPEDLEGTPEAPITRAIAELAQSLNWNPVSIYEWVKNNIETEWYWGSMKGAEETLGQKAGNDCDQASLLISLLRASGYPSRYVRGVIEFFPGIERAKNLTGVDDPTRIVELFQKAGIPFKLVIAGGRISNLQIEHIWVETEVPYANYRGAILDGQGNKNRGVSDSRSLVSK